MENLAGMMEGFSQVPPPALLRMKKKKWVRLGRVKFSRIFHLLLTGSSKIETALLLLMILCLDGRYRENFNNR